MYLHIFILNYCAFVIFKMNQISPVIRESYGRLLFWLIVVPVFIGWIRMVEVLALSQGRTFVRDITNIRG